MNRTFLENKSSMLRSLTCVAAALVVASSCGGSTPPSKAPAANSATAKALNDGWSGSASAAAPTVTAKPVDSKVIADIASMPDDVALPLRSDIKKGKLANGLTYYILPHAKPKNRAYLWLAVNAGSVQEDDDQRGLAHLVEHMAFNGTKNFPKSAIVDYIEKIGMKFGADLNAYTSFDQTVYQLEVPTDKKEFVEKGMDILRDWAGEVSFDPAEVEKERGVVLEEWRLGRGAQARLFDKVAPVLFKGSRYADRLTIGLPDTIQKAPREAVMRFYKDWYRPDLMAVIVVGEIDPAQIEKMIGDRFATLKNPEKARPRTVAGVPVANGPRVSIATDKELPATLVQVYNMIAHREESTGNSYRRTVAESLYNAMLSARLNEVSKRSDSPFLFAASSDGSFAREVDGMVRVAAAKPGKAEQALRTLFTEVRRAEQFGFTAPEFDRAKKTFQRAIDQSATSADTNDGREFADEATRNFFEGEMMSGRDGEAALAKKYLPKITVDEINALVKSWGGDSTRTVIVNGPDGKPLPTEAQITKILSDVQKLKLEPWGEEAIAGELFPGAAALKPGNVVSTKKFDSSLGNMIEWTLPNGVRVIVKPTDFEKDKVLITGFASGGMSMATDKEYAAVRFANQVADLGGLGQYDSITLGKLLAGKQLNLDSFIGETESMVTGSSSVQDLETAMQLVHLKMTGLRSDAGEFAIWKTNTKASVADQLRDPNTVFGRESTNLFYKNHARTKAFDAADIDKADYAKSMAFFAQRFSNAANFTFVIVGSVSADKVQALVEKYIGSLPSAPDNKKTDQETDRKVRYAPGVVNKTWKLGTEPKARVRLRFVGDQTWSRQDKYDMAILGDVLNIRLREVLREDMSGVYGVGARGSISRGAYQSRQFSIDFGCAPDKLEALVKATFETIASVQKDGTTSENLDKVKQTYSRGHEAQLADNDAWMSWLTQAFEYGDDPTLFLSVQPLLSRISNDNLKAAAKKFLDDKHYLLAKMIPLKAK
jgi:zinc protease